MKSSPCTDCADSRDHTAFEEHSRWGPRSWCRVPRSPSTGCPPPPPPRSSLSVTRENSHGDLRTGTSSTRRRHSLVADCLKGTGAMGSRPVKLALREDAQPARAPLLGGLRTHEPFQSADDVFIVFATLAMVLETMDELEVSHASGRGRRPCAYLSSRSRLHQAGATRRAAPPRSAPPPAR